VKGELEVERNLTRKDTNGQNITSACALGGDSDLNSCELKRSVDLRDRGWK
jgi:hypothetical protein